jgi:organic radical activating enzyme
MAGKEVDNWIDTLSTVLGLAVGSLLSMVRCFFCHLRCSWCPQVHTRRDRDIVGRAWVDKMIYEDAPKSS